MRQNRRHDFAHHPVCRQCFEHCIANLFVIPFAIAIRHSPLPPSGNWRTVAQTIFRHCGQPFYYRQSAPGDAG